MWSYLALVLKKRKNIHKCRAYITYLLRQILTNIWNYKILIIIKVLNIEIMDSSDLSFQ